MPEMMAGLAPASIPPVLKAPSTNIPSPSTWTTVPPSSPDSVRELQSIALEVRALADRSAIPSPMLNISFFIPSPAGTSRAKQLWNRDDFQRVIDIDKIGVT